MSNDRNRLIVPWWGVVSMATVLVLFVSLEPRLVSRFDNHGWSIVVAYSAACFVLIAAIASILFVGTRNQLTHRRRGYLFRVLVVVVVTVGTFATFDTMVGQQLAKVGVPWDIGHFSAGLIACIVAGVVGGTASRLLHVRFPPRQSTPAPPNSG